MTMRHWVGYFKPEARQWWELQYIADYLGAAHHEEVPDKVFRAAYGSVASVAVSRCRMSSGWEMRPE